MKKFFIFITFLFLSQSCLCLAAQEKPKAPKEPEDNALPYFVTTAVYPVEKGEFEIIIQPMYSCGKEEKDLFFFPSISYGVTDSWQVYLNVVPYIIQWETEQRTSGLGDIDMGSQYSWMYINKSTFSAAFLFNIHIPTADINKNLTDGFLRYEPYFLFAKDFLHPTYRVQFFSQVGFSIAQRLKSPSDEEDQEPGAHSFILNTGVAIRTEKVNYSVEFNWVTNTWNNGGDDNELYVTPGIYVQVKENIALGIGVPIGLNNDADHFAIIGNLLVDIPSLDAKKEDKDKKETTNDHGVVRKPSQYEGISSAKKRSKR